MTGLNLHTGRAKSGLLAVAALCLIASSATALSPVAIAPEADLAKVTGLLEEARVCGEDGDLAAALSGIEAAFGAEAGIGWTCLPEGQEIVGAVETTGGALIEDRPTAQDALIEAIAAAPVPPLNVSSLQRLWGPPEFPVAEAVLATLAATRPAGRDPVLVLMGAGGRYLELVPMGERFDAAAENTAMATCNRLATICRGAAIWTGSDAAPAFYRP